MKLNCKESTQVASAAKCEVIKVGLDVHALKIAASVQRDGQTPQPSQLLYRPHIVEWLKQLQKKEGAKRIVTCYEAGPLGYVLHRQLEAAGIRNYVVVPQRLDTDGRGQKTDRLDARALAERLDRYERGNERAFSIVRVPTEEQEKKRAKVRLREQLMRSRRQHEARGRSLLLQHGIQVKGAWWRGRQWENLAAQLPEWVLQIVSVHQELAATVDAKEREVRQELEQAAPEKLPVGMGALTSTILQREILDWQRFKNRRQVASYTGLCPGIRQSGDRRYYGSINRHGNPAVRHALIELIWRFTRYQPQYPPVRRLVERCLTPRDRRRTAVAAARHLAIDLWRLNTGQTTPEKLKLVLD